ncbi:MAG: dienelactone hydrolase family protein [Rhodospirillales bacterium]|nr:dienelactone hydrolase family protein [Rhodospirillales bacterium]
MKQILLICAVVMGQSVLAVDKKPLTKEESAKVNSIFNTEEILDENTLETKTLQDWHPVGATRQKLIEINVAQWWPGQDYRIPVRLIVPLEGKAKGFSITGANPYETLMKDARPTDFQAKLLAGGVGIVKTHVKAFRQIPGKQGLEQKMRRVFMKDLNPRYTTLWIWSMTLMRATTAAYAETDYFEKGKVAGSGSSKNGISPAVALINDERFTATCSDHAFAYYSPTRRADREEVAKADAANKAFFEAVKAGDIELEQQRGKIYQRVMVGSERSMDKMALKAGRSMDEFHDMKDRLLSSVCVAENWDRLMERGVDVLFQPGTHDYVAYDVLWGAQNHPQLPVYYKPSGGHSQTPHVAAAKDEQNRDAFLWHHFFGGDPLMKPPTSSHKVDKDKLSVSVSFNEGPQPISGRIWWIYDRAPAGSAPFLHVQIPEDQWADMERDPKTGSWTATIPLQEGASRVDFFTNHGHMSNGYQQYLSSPYTRVELSLSQKRSRQVGDAALNKALEEINGRFKNVDVELLEWPEKLQQRLGKLKQIAFLATPVKTPAGKLPLLISLHGGGQRWWNMSLQEQLAISAPGGKIEKLRGFKKLRGYDLAELAGKGMILLEPNTAGLWDADSLDTMLDYVLANYPKIDKDRVYVMGYSMGGRGTWAWINESADRFAAAAPCGFNPADTGDVKKLVKLPIWAMAGGADGDRTTGVRKMVERLRAAGNVNVKHTEFEGADHRAGLAVFSSVELVEWMLEFSKGK